MNRELRDTLKMGETLTVEFKSDRKPLPDRELVAAIVALANTEGGTLFLGVEDDGTVTGAHRNHQDSAGLAALIANKTNPSIALRADLFDLDGKTIVVVQVPKNQIYSFYFRGPALTPSPVDKWKTRSCALLPARIYTAPVFHGAC